MLKVIVAVMAVAIVAMAGGLIGLGVAFNKKANEVSDLKEREVLPECPSPPEPYIPTCDAESSKLLNELVIGKIKDNHRTIGAMAFRTPLTVDEWTETTDRIKGMLDGARALSELERVFGKTCTGYEKASYTLDNGKVMDAVTHQQTLYALSTHEYIHSYDDMRRYGGFEVYCSDDAIYRDTKDLMNLAVFRITELRKTYADAANVAAMTSPTGTAYDYDEAKTEFQFEKHLLDAVGALSKKLDSGCNASFTKLDAVFDERLALSKYYYESCPYKDCDAFEGQ